MAHWAEVDENNIVLRVLVGNDDDPNEGYDWLVENLGGTWIKTSYNNRIRMNYAGVGYTYDPVEDWFVAPQPYPSWILTRAAQWVAPVKYPDDGLVYQWNEEITDWEAVNYER
jgi:hypothetical protein